MAVLNALLVNVTQALVLLLLSPQVASVSIPNKTHDNINIKAKLYVAMEP